MLKDLRLLHQILSELRIEHKGAIERLERAEYRIQMIEMIIDKLSVSEPEVIHYDSLEEFYRRFRIENPGLASHQKMAAEAYFNKVLTPDARKKLIDEEGDENAAIQKIRNRIRNLGRKRSGSG